MGKITGYASAASVVGDELIPCIQGGVNKNITPSQLIGGYEVKNVLQQITVGSSLGADYTSLNTAITNIGTVKTFRIVTAVTLTAAIVFPADVTLIIGAQGSLAGAYTLTGNNTAIKFEGHNNCFNTNITWAGTYKIHALRPEQFGAVADGATDDRAAINEALALARLTPNKTVIFAGRYKISDSIDVSNTRSDCRPGMHIEGTNGKVTIAAVGTIGTYYALDEDALIGEYSIICSNATFLASLAVGDLINIHTDALYGLGYPLGEIVKVMEIEDSTGEIVFKTPLHGNYIVGQGADVARINPARYENTGVMSISCPIMNVSYDSDRATNGAWFNFIEDLDVNIKASKYGDSAIGVSNCYQPVVHGRVNHTEVNGLGYGLTIAGATMFGKYYGNYVGARCGVNFGGSTTGPPWDNKVIDVIAGPTVQDDGAGFMTHYNTGTVDFINCTALGMGINETRHAGFCLNGKISRLINCTTRDLYQAIFSTGDVRRSVEIYNFSAYNCRYGFSGTTNSPFENLTVDGFSLMNDQYASGAAFYFNVADILRWSFNNIKVINLTQVFNTPRNINYPNTYPKQLIVNNLEHRVTDDSGNYESSDATGAATFYHTADDIEEVIFNNVVQENVGALVEANSATAMMKIIQINNAFIRGTMDGSIVYPHLALDLMRFSNCIFKNPAQATSVFKSDHGATTISFIGCMSQGDIKWLADIPAGETFTNLQHMGNNFVGLTAGHKTLAPTNTLTSGSIGL